MTAKEEKTLGNFLENEPVYTAILETLRNNVSDRVWLEPKPFITALTGLLSSVTVDKKLIGKIAHSLSVRDKSAEIQRDRKKQIIWDDESKDAERIAYTEDIDTYMAREVLPHIPDAQAFFEEDLGAKTPIVKTGAKIPFTKYFYRYQVPESSETYRANLVALDQSAHELLAPLLQEGVSND